MTPATIARLIIITQRSLQAESLLTYDHPIVQKLQLDLITLVAASHFMEYDVRLLPRPQTQIS